MMTKRRLVLIAALILVACPGQFPFGATSRPALAALAERLADREFWQLSSDFSEPNGEFGNSDNVMSNEIFYQYVIPDLIFRTKPHRAYIGVGPEQNFTYIAAV